MVMDSDILSHCSRVLKKLGLEEEINLHIENNEDSRVFMNYKIRSKTVSINAAAIKRYSKEYDMPFENLIQIVFYHELGHHFDKELSRTIGIRESILLKNYLEGVEKERNDIFNKLTFEAEVRAWEIAEELIEPNLRNDFLTVKEISLDWYAKKHSQNDAHL